MHSYDSVVKQLHDLGFRPGRIFKGEVSALADLLLPDEVIEQYMTGRHMAGPAIMVATNRRLLLVDKKPFNLTVEDIPYDMVSEIEYCMQTFNATIAVHSISKTIEMMSFRQSMLRRFASFVQARVMHIRATRQNQGAMPTPAQQMAQAPLEPEPVKHVVPNVALRPFYGQATESKTEFELPVNYQPANGTELNQ